MVAWVKEVILPYVKKERCLLVFDSFRAQTSKMFEKEILKHDNIDIAIIPGGYTGILQPLDISINRSFKSDLRSTYMQWLKTKTNYLFKTEIPQQPIESIQTPVTVRHVELEMKPGF